MCVILYLEDDELHVKLFSFIIKKYVNNNIDVIWKKTIDNAYDYLINNKVDIVFIDRILDDGVGDDLVYRILINKIIDKNKVFILSSINNINEIEKFNKLGIKYYTKPINTKLLITDLKKLT